ncbi:hypothetical protein OKW21_001513 [Catalinimonas alkaloidigena]|uniref:hypothetical protein n=1 Tax=Catalinimonas alkaloidigena TaxID=1075417 RepID=UPI0024053E29|nr:hypothetical protein [Catalinimonas alkaloidigena]MDF9796250.1 hypothetical protein [Catalinimonas alkaloidigena]
MLKHLSALPKSIAIGLIIFSFSLPLAAQYTQPEPQVITANVIPVSEPGSYGKAGATYMLTSDISSDRSAVFLGKDVTLDLNGYTITYADGNYRHIPNYGFEEGVKGWNISKAPGAKVVNTADVHAFIGEKLMSLEAGDEIVSPYIDLPVAHRSYFAMCGVTGRYYQDMDGDINNNMQVSIYVEDEKGDIVQCITEYGDTTLISSPIENKSPRLGGGFITAHLNNIPAGKYRIRVKANTDCLVDEIDIRPAMDVGIGIVDQTHPYGHYDHLYNIKHAAFFDYTEDVSESIPLSDMPQVEGEGTITIKNGIIKNGTVGVMSWGIQSTAEKVKIILDNVKIISSGINTTAVDVPSATITNCTFDIDNPFIINRHGAQFYAVDLRGEQTSEVSYSEFFGGQGCLVFKGDHSSIHHNYFVNHQLVTNHYSIMAIGDSSKIFENRIEPKVGSGIEIYRHRGIEIFNNVIKIEAAPPSCEYNDLYSTNAIRIADYGAEKKSPRGAYGNRVYNNSFYITGKKYPQYPDYIPLASAIFYSASAGDNYIFGNEIILENQDPETDAEAYAFYIGNTDGGQIYNNEITANVTPVWIASAYGSAANTHLYNNRFSKSPNTTRDFIPIRMGYSERSDCFAKDIEFCSNAFENLAFAIEREGEAPVSYEVYWTLTVELIDSQGNKVKNEAVKIINNNGQEVFRGKTDQDGLLQTELAAYAVDKSGKNYSSPYKVFVKNQKKKVSLDDNRKITIQVQ